MVRINFKKSKGIFSKYQDPIKRYKKIKMPNRSLTEIRSGNVEIINGPVKVVLELKSYKDYLQTSHWKKLRRKMLKLSNFRCEQCCSSSRLQVHHKRYRSKNNKPILYNEQPKDLMVLCELCHQKIHDIII